MARPTIMGAANRTQTGHADRAQPLQMNSGAKLMCDTCGVARVRASWGPNYRWRVARRMARRRVQPSRRLSRQRGSRLLQASRSQQCCTVTPPRKAAGTCSIAHAQSPKKMLQPAPQKFVTQRATQLELTFVCCVGDGFVCVGWGARSDEIRGRRAGCASLTLSHLFTSI